MSKPSLAKSLGGYTAPEAPAEQPATPPKPSAPHNAGEAKAAKPNKERAMGKSRNPDFQKLTVYIREKTRKAVAIQLLQEGQGREVSELVEDLLDGWTTKRPAV